MSKDRATIGTDGKPLPLLPPERDARVWARLVRVMFYLPGFMALLLIKSGEPTSFGISVELLMMLIILLFIPSDYAGPCFIGFAIGESLGAAGLRLDMDDLAAIEAAVPAGAAAGTRYDAMQMSFLDSER